MEYKIFNFKNIRQSSVYITPNLPVLRTKRYKVSLPKLLFYFSFYTFFVIVLVITILALTPIKEVIFIIENEKLIEQEVRIKELEKKIFFLSQELEEMASTNKRLKYAILLGTIDSVDTNSAIYDSLRIDENMNKPAEGNIILSVFYFVKSLFINQKSEIFFMRPSQGFLFNEFNPKKGHMGVDFSVKVGSPVYAAESGLVLFSDFTAGDGYKIIIQHNDGFVTIYKHCSVLIKKERDFVERGELIALSGNSGENTTGAHLHFEIWKEGKPLDPKNLLINETE